MLLFQHGDRLFNEHGWWWGFSRGIVPLLLLALIGVTVWAVLRSSRTPGPAPSVAVRADGALGEVRLRYARGEIDREEFLQRARDLGLDPELGQPPSPQGG